MPHCASCPSNRTSTPVTSTWDVFWRYPCMVRVNPRTRELFDLFSPLSFIFSGNQPARATGLELSFKIVLTLNSELWLFFGDPKLCNLRLLGLFWWIGDDSWGNDHINLTHSKIAFQWHIICLCLVPFTKKITFFETNYKNCQLKLLCFACRANWDSKSESETTLKLVSTLKIQWRCQNGQISFC